MTEEEAEKIVKYEYLTIEIHQVEWKDKRDARPLEPSQNRSENTGKARSKGTVDNSHIGHCTHTAGSANVQVQTVFNMASNITCSIYCKYRRAAILYTQVTWFVSGI